MARREYTDAELHELVRTVRAARAAARGPDSARVMFVLMVLAFATLLVALVLVGSLPTRRAADFWPWIAASVLAVAASYFAGVRARRRFKRRVLARDARVCPGCHYDLSSEPRADAQAFCPECREPYRPNELPAIWRSFSPSMLWWD